MPSKLEKAVVVSRKLSDDKVYKKKKKKNCFEASSFLFFFFYYLLESQLLHAPGNVELTRFGAPEQILGFDRMWDNSAEDLCHLIIALIFVSSNKQAYPAVARVAAFGINI